MSAVTREIIQHVADLARLRLEEDALHRLAPQVAEILHYVEQLQAVPTEHVPPTSHVLPLANVLRDDDLKPSLNPETVCALAPASQYPFVTVPKVLEG